MVNELIIFIGLAYKIMKKKKVCERILLGKLLFNEFEYFRAAVRACAHECFPSALHCLQFLTLNLHLPATLHTEGCSHLTLTPFPYLLERSVRIVIVFKHCHSRLIRRLTGIYSNFFNLAILLAIKAAVAPAAIPLSMFTTVKPSEHV